MSRLVAVLAMTLALACGREVVFVDPPPTSSTDTTGTDTTGTDTTVVQRVDLEVTVTIAPADTALARHLGMANGRLSNAQVTARRVAGQQGPQTGTTDSLGQVTLPGLIEGTWAITTLRPLSEAERASLDSANRDVTGFAGATQLSVARGAESVTIVAPAGRGGSLVINEGYLPYPTVTSSTGSEYVLGQYLEVHNNSLETLYLGGLIIGRAPAFVSDGRSFPCSASAKLREDPDGIWSQRFWAFPGGSGDYPLLPGDRVIVATDAIDHRVIHPDLLDLSRADFEFIGNSNDVDNPEVPNMRNFAGWSVSGGDPIGHGPWWVNELSVFLSEAVDPDSLVRDNLPLPIPLYVRFPREKIIDVVTSGSTPETRLGAPYCANFVHPSFDGRFAELVDGTTSNSIARKVSSSLLGLVQRTKVSAVDFWHQPPTPGTLQ
jgi:hypothetical protein